MAYHQITSEERYTIAALRGEGFNKMLIPLLVEGELRGPERVRLGHHLADCSRCEELVETLDDDSDTIVGALNSADPMKSFWSVVKRACRWYRKRSKHFSAKKPSGM